MGKGRNRIKYGEEQAKMGMGEQEFFDLPQVYNRVYNREHAWKGGREAGYPNILMVISHITRYLIKLDIFWEIEDLQDVHDLVQDSLVLAGLSPFLWFDFTNLIIIFGSPRYNDFGAFKNFWKVFINIYFKIFSG